MSPASDRDLIRSIPSPDRIRRRLADVLCEAEVLRSLLRTAVAREKRLGQAEANPVRESPYA
jgi:hypothetical protein